LKLSLQTKYSDLPGYAAKYAAVAAQKAVFADKLQDYHQAYYQKLAYREIESKWHKIASDQEAERSTVLLLLSPIQIVILIQLRTPPSPRQRTNDK